MEQVKSHLLKSNSSVLLSMRIGSLFACKRILLFLFLIIFSLPSFAQRKKLADIGIMGGASYYLGDLNTFRHFWYSKPAGGIFYRHIINPRYALRLNGFYGNVYAYDSDSKYLYQRNRNLSFKSSIFEVSGQIEFNFLPYETGSDKKWFSPYVFVGLGLFHFNPKAKLGSDWYELQPLGTEGQGTIAYQTKKYSLTQTCIPFGVGTKWSISQKLGLGLEWGLRKTYTDYIDDVSTSYANPYIIQAEEGVIASTLSDRSVNGGSEFISNSGRQRGNSRNKDWYSFTGITLSYKLGGGALPCMAY